MQKKHLAYILLAISFVLALSALAFLFNGLRLHHQRLTAEKAKPQQTATAPANTDPRSRASSTPSLDPSSPAADPSAATTQPDPADIPAPGTALAVGLSFLDSVLGQNYQAAKSFVDPTSVSDAKLAGLCILFEEGHYQLRKTKPLRAMFERGDTSGMLAAVESADGSQTAQFAFTMRKSGDQAEDTPAWKITEINLDKLLADYANHIGGGDVFFSPLVKNPTGGETLALYFDFDQAEMNPRTRRQLEIVSQLLKADAGKKITLSGHTDALGSDTYNHDLSANRAKIVRDFLVAAGVQPEQIVTLAKGASQPRRPNITASGEDDPTGRRANRRTEIYLDF